MDGKCPGTDSRFIDAESVKCGKCGYEVEIFSDEIRSACPKCGSEVARARIPSCVDWCKSARECVGDERWAQILKRRKTSPGRDDFKERILMEMRKHFGADAKRIQHAASVLRYAEKILEKEKGDRSVVVAAAILHDIGIRECEKKYGDAGGQLQEKEGPPIAEKILSGLGIRNEVITEACSIIASHHSPGEIETLNFRILWDADMLANLPDIIDVSDKGKVKKALADMFATGTGRGIAENVYLGGTEMV